MPMPCVVELPMRIGGNGPLLEGVISERLVSPGGNGPLVILGILACPGGSGPLVTLGILVGLLGERRSSGSGWMGAFERGSAEVARPFATVGFTYPPWFPDDIPGVRGKEKADCWPGKPEAPSAGMGIVS